MNKRCNIGRLFTILNKNIMKTKFEEIEEFVDSLENESITEIEQSYLLVGGQGDARGTNEGCTNFLCPNVQC